MAVIKKDVTLGALTNNIHQMNYELLLTDGAKSFVDSLNIGDDREREALKQYMETFFGNGEEFNAKAEEWGFEENVDRDKHVLAAFAQFLSNWKKVGFDTTTTRIDTDCEDSYLAFQLSCCQRTSNNNVFRLETESGQFDVFIANNKELSLTSSDLDKIDILTACDIVIPRVNIELEQDYTPHFDGSKAIVNGDMFDIESVSTKAKIKLDKEGVIIKQMSKMVMSFSGCLAYVPPIFIDDEFRLVVAHKGDSGYSVLFDFLIEKSDFTKA